MSQGDDGAPERPASTNMPAAAPRPKPPVPTAARKAPPPPPAHEANPFLTPDSSRGQDVGWLAPEDAAEVALPPASPEAAPPPVGRRSRGKAVAFLLVAVLVLGGGGFVYRSQVHTRSATVERAAPETSVEAIVEPPQLATLPAPPPTYTAEPPPSASAAKKKPAAGAGTPVSADPATQGILDTTQLPPGRKIVVDGRVVGTSPRKLAVRCGTHRIQIGDLPPESIAFPCGGEVSFTD